MQAAALMRHLKGLTKLPAFIQDSNYPENLKETTFSVCRGTERRDSSEKHLA